MRSSYIVVFDLDGTLVDSRPDIAAACNHALVKSGRLALGMEEIALHVGNGARRLCSGAAALSVGDPELDSILESFMDYYRQHPVVDSMWMPHALETLDALRDMRLAVCTNKPAEIARRALEVMGAMDRFSVLVGGGDTAEVKPSPQPLLLVASRLGVNGEQLIMVGDGTQDVLAGRAAGARTIAVGGGFMSMQALRQAGPDAFAESLAEVPTIIERWTTVLG